MNVFDGGYGLIGSCSACCDGVFPMFVASGAVASAGWCGWPGFLDVYNGYRAGNPNPTVLYQQNHTVQISTDIRTCPAGGGHNDYTVTLNSASCALSASGYLSSYDCSTGTTNYSTVTSAGGPANEIGFPFASNNYNGSTTSTDYYGGTDTVSLTTTNDGFTYDTLFFGGTPYEQTLHMTSDFTIPSYYTDILPTALTNYSHTAWGPTGASFYLSTGGGSVSVKGGEYAIMLDLPDYLSATQSYAVSWSLITTDGTGSIVSQVSMSTTLVGYPGQHVLSSSWYAVSIPSVPGTIYPANLHATK